MVFDDSKTIATQNYDCAINWAKVVPFRRLTSSSCASHQTGRRGQSLSNVQVAVFADTFIQQDRPVDGLDDFEQGDIPGFARQGHAATRATRGMEQSRDGQLRDDLGEE